MAHTIRTDDEQKLVVATLEGTFGMDDVMPLVAQARELAHTEGYSLLYDFSAAVPGKITRADLFWMPRRLPVLSDPGAPKAKAALVHPPEFASFAGFWETTFTNSGLRARAFTDISAALGWLAED